MPRITKVIVGSPMGFKVNICSELNGVVLNSLIKSLEVYHGGSYVVGKDTLFGVKPHYHIHWYSVKDVSESAIKVKRNSLGKEFSWLTKSDKIYTGQDLESANPNQWLAYAIKEKLVENKGIEITAEIEKLASVSLETKRQKKVYSEKKALDEKEKKEFKFKMFDSIKKDFPDLESYGSEYYGANEEDVFYELCIGYLMSNSKYGSMKMNFLRQWYIEFKSEHSNDKWSNKDILKFIRNR